MTDRREFSLDDMLRIGAENNRLKAKIAELEKRLDDNTIVRFGSKVVEATQVWCADRATMGPFAPLKPDLDLYSLLREFRRIG